MAMRTHILTNHPVLLHHQEERARSLQNRIADAITAFAGSMTFVYIHIVWFGLWIGLGAEDYPYGLLTMIVSLEAIFLSTFVLISQNRQDALRAHLAGEDHRLNQEEDLQNQELLRLSNEILRLTQSIEKLTKAHTGSK